MKPWKSTLAGVLGAILYELQWGHGDEAVEEVVSVTSPAVSINASMGPRR